MSTILFVKKLKMPSGRKKTYAIIAVNVRPQKMYKTNRVHITVEGNLIDYPGEVRIETADLRTSNSHWNTMIPTPGAKYMCADVKTIYFNMRMERYEYMQMHISLIPYDII